MELPGEDAKVVINQHYDESLDINDSEEVTSIYSPSPRKSPTQGDLSFDHAAGSGEPELLMASEPSPDGSDELDADAFASTRKDEALEDKNKNMLLGTTNQSSLSEGDSDDDDDSSSTEDEDNLGVIEGAYDPADYDHLTVSQEIKELFQYITRYTPQTIELEHKLKPFNPDYIPAVGDIDAFLKVPRPDHRAVTLGLTVLDEPSAKQSDPTVFDLQLRSISKTSSVRAMQVRSVKNADRNPKSINTWVENMADLHRTKPPQTVHYAKRMPDIDLLMEEWPQEMEELLSKTALPSAQLDCSLQTYVEMICSMLDIPVHKNKIQSLHVLFSLYSAFKELHHFQSDNMHHNQEVAGTNASDVMKFD